MPRATKTARTRQTRKGALASGNGLDSLSAAEWSKLKAWHLDYLCHDSTQKPAMLAFTAGAARDAATAFESAVFEATGRRIGSPNKEISG